MSELIERVEQSIAAHGLLSRGQSALVAVSGGVDSMVLLAVLHELAPRRGWQLAVAHLNHQLRGRSSDADQRLAAATARRFGLRFVAGRADVKRYAQTHRLSVEMAARKLRHEFLARTAARLQIRAIALAHHADDQLELFFLRLFRGSGGEGLAGMKWRNPSPANPRVQLIRPLLGQSKAELHQFAAQRRIPFRHDASNARLDIQRNRIRHELLPLLREKYQPALDQTVLRAMDIAGAEAEAVTALARDWLAAGRGSAFAELPVAVQRRCIQLQLLRRKICPDFEWVEQLRISPGRNVTVAPDLEIERGADGELRLRRRRRSAGREARPLELELNGAHGEADFGPVKIQWRFEPRRVWPLPAPRAGREFFDADKVGGRIVLRRWRAGDRFQPIGMPAPVKLQDLFVNRKVPRARRHQLALATTADGEIFWVETLRISERFKLSEATKHCLRWQWERC